MHQINEEPLSDEWRSFNLVSDSLYCAMVKRLDSESSQPVLKALGRFRPLPTASTPVFYISRAPPSLFTSFEGFEASFDTCLTLPMPLPNELSQLQATYTKVIQRSPSGFFSIGVRCSSRHVHFPHWMLKMWSGLGRLSSLCNRWVHAESALRETFAISGPHQRLALSMLGYLQILPLDLEVPVFSPLHTSDISILITNSWLSGEHLNVGCELINSHSNRLKSVFAVNTYFLTTLASHFTRHSTWAPRHQTTLDFMVASGSVDELLIPVHSTGHWSLLHVSVSSKAYAYVNTLRLDDTTMGQPTIRSLDLWLSSVLKQQVALSPGSRPFQVGAQSDSHSCGIAVLSSMAHYALRGFRPPWTQSTSHEHRLWWGVEISGFLQKRLTASTKSIPKFDLDTSLVQTNGSSPNTASETASVASLFEASQELSSPAISTRMEAHLADSYEIIDVDSDDEADSALWETEATSVGSLRNTTSAFHPPPAQKPRLAQSKLLFTQISGQGQLALTATRNMERGEARKRDLKRLRSLLAKRKIKSLGSSLQKRTQLSRDGVKRNNVTGKASVLVPIKDTTLISAIQPFSTSITPRSSQSYRQPTLREYQNRLRPVVTPKSSFPGHEEH